MCLVCKELDSFIKASVVCRQRRLTAHLTCTWNKPIKYLLDDLHQILQNLPTLADILVCNDGCGQVTQDVGAHGLDRIEVPGWGKRIKAITLSRWSKAPSPVWNDTQCNISDAGLTPGIWDGAKTDKSPRREPSFWTRDSALSRHLSLEPHWREEEKETLARRYRSVSRDLPSSWNLIHGLLMFQLQVNWLNTRDKTPSQAASNPKTTLETVFC